MKNILGEVGQLDEEILEEWEFWKLVKHNSNFLIFEENLSFPDMQKLNAILDMGNDYESAMNEYENEKITNISNK